MLNKKFLLLALVIILITGIFASYTLGNPKDSIQERYSRGENIQGWVNISLQNESATSILNDSFGNSITLINLLKTDQKHNYSCNPEDCESFYSPENLGPITLNAGQEKIIGFNLKNVNIDEITNFSLRIISTAGSSSQNQLKIDLFNDGTEDIGNTKLVENVFQSNSVNYGCFDILNDPPEKKEYETTGATYCQRIKLSEAPGFRLGIWTKKISGTPNLTMRLYDIDEDDWQKEECFLIPGQGNEVTCDIKYLVTQEKDYYVCSSPSGSSTGSYRIKGYTYVDECGFKDNPLGNPEEIAAYQIFAIPNMFAEVGELKIEDINLPSGDLISGLIKDYLFNNYGGSNCIGKDCIIPIKLTSNAPQTLTITGKIEYDETGGGTTSETKVYNLAESPSLINSGFQKIFLNDANFTVPNDLGKYNFTLSLDGTEILTKQIEVKKGIEIISLNPTKTAAGLPTNFKIKVNTNNATITEYKWDFNNDGIMDKTTLTNTAKYTYDSIGNYKLITSVEDSAGISSSKIFDIEVSSAKDVLGELITKEQESLSDIRGEILNYDLFSSSAIENILNLSGAENSLQNINDKYLLIKDSGTEQEFQLLLSELLEIDLPESTNKILDFAPLTFFPKTENIDLKIIEEIAGGDYNADLEEEYREAISAWHLNNIQTKVSMKEYSANYEEGTEMLVKVFKLDINNLGTDEDSYLFINGMEGIYFKENPTYDDSSGYYYKESSSGSIEFYTTEDMKIENLPIFISPSLEKLEIDSGTGIEPGKAGKKFKGGLFALITISLILIGFMIYLFLKKWYKEKYENYLFKNKNDLYNMVSYVHKAKQQGKNEKIIIKDLGKAGWNNEQINYVIKKYSGKNVGMPSL